MSSGILADPCLSAINSRRRILFRKCLAEGIMYPTWFSRPTSVWASSKVIDFCAMAFSIEEDQLVTFSCGRFILKGLVWIDQPRKMSGVSWSLPSASIFRRDCGSGRGMGSFGDNGRKQR